MTSPLPLLANRLSLHSWPELSSVTGSDLPHFDDQEIGTYITFCVELVDLTRTPTNERLDAAINATAVLARYAAKDLEVHRWLSQSWETANKDGLTADEGARLVASDVTQRFSNTVIPSFRELAKALNWVSQECTETGIPASQWPHTEFRFLNEEPNFGNGEKAPWIERSSERLHGCFLRE